MSNQISLLEKQTLLSLRARQIIWDRVNALIAAIDLVAELR
jgi:hypothetical protein